MPHPLSSSAQPFSLPTMEKSIVVPQISGTVPTAGEISSLLQGVFGAKTSQQSLDASYALANVLIKSVGVRGLLSSSVYKYNVLPEIRKGTVDKKSGARRESAMLILGALFECFPREKPASEAVFLIQDGGVLNLALDALADKGVVVRDSAQYAIDALFSFLKPESMVNALLPALLRYLGKGTGKWQGAVGAFALLERMAHKAKMGSGSKGEEREKDILREAMGRTLKEVIPVVESGMHDLKTEVAKQATKAMSAVTTLITNEDVIPRIPLLIKTDRKSVV